MMNRKKRSISISIYFLTLIILVALFASPVIAQHSGENRKVTKVLPKVSKTVSADFSDGLIQAISRPELIPRIQQAGYIGVADQAAVISGSLQEFPRSGSQYIVLSTGLAEDVPGTATTFSSVSTGGVSIPGGSPDGFNAFDVATLTVRLDLTDLPTDHPPRLVFRYKFCSEEPPSFWGSIFQDYFTAFLRDTTGQTIENIATLPNGDPFTIDNARPFMNQVQGSSQDPLPPFPQPNDVVFNACTGIHTTIFDLSDYGDDLIDLEFQIGDVGDSAFDSAVFIDGFDIQSGPLPNFWVDRVEFNQASQSFDNGSNVAAEQLIAGKPIVVRAYIAGEGNEVDPKRISAALHVFRNGIEVAGSPFRPLPLRVQPVQSPSRTAVDTNGRPTQTLQFYPPGSTFTEPGTYQYFIMADPDHEVDETDKSNNRFPVSGFNNVTFHEQMEVNILGYRVTTVDENGNIVDSWDDEDETRYARGRLLTRNMLPAPSVRFWRVGTGEIEWNLSSDGDLSTINGVVAMLDDIVARMEDINDWSEVGYQTVAAIFPRNTDLGARGWGWPGRPGSLARTLEEDTLPHEIAHNWLPDGSLPGPPDDNHECSTSGDDGFFVSERRLRLNASNLLCGGMTNRWVSPTTYQALFDSISFTPSDEIIGAQKMIAQQPAEALRIRGYINEEGELLMRPVQTIESELFSSDEADAAFRLELRNEQDDLIEDYGFNIASLLIHNGQEHDHSESGRFSLVVPRPENLSSITVKSSGTESGKTSVQQQSVFERIEVSENPPEVTVLQPSGGEVIEGTFTIEWEGSDPDGDELTYTILYSGDGQSWGVLENDLQTTSFDWDATGSPGGNQAQIRVVASDGVNTANALSGIFTVPDKDPQAMILSPEQGFEIPVGGTVTFTGSGDDFEDGTLSGENLLWSSDNDGELGFGESLGTNLLSQGSHTITLTAIDNSGNTGTDSITLSVVDTAPAPPASLSATPGNGKVKLEWSPGSGQTAGYKVFWGTSSGSYGADFDAGPSLQHTVENLNNGTLYYFAVKAYDEIGNESDFSEEIEAEPMDMPATPQLISPLHEADDVTLPPTLEWSAVDGADFYTLQISTDSQFTEDVTELDELNTNSHEMSGLEEFTTYYWHVRAVADDVAGLWSETRQFTTGLATSLSENEVPAEFMLSQNYPNPFNPITVIEFGLPVASHVQLEVYDILGRRVASLENGMRNAGWHKVSFNASSLSTGVYIYRLYAIDSSGEGRQRVEFVQTKKMMLIK